MYWPLFFLTLILSFCLQLKGQSLDEKNFTLYSTKDGLSNNYITSIEQDAYGYLWIGTRKGLNRFDGSTFQSFYSDTSKNSLPQDFIFSLKWLDKEQLAAVTLNGLHIVNTRTLSRRNLIIPADSLKSLQPLNSVFDVTSDKKGNIFIITRTGFYQFNGKDELVFRYDHYSQKQVETGPVQFGWEIMLADENTVLISAAKGLFIYNVDQRNLHPANNTDNEFYRQIVPTPQRFWFAHNDEKSFSVMYYDKKEFYYFDTQKKTKRLITDSASIVKNLRQESRLLQVNDSFFIINAPISGFYGIHYNSETAKYKFEPGPYFKDYLCLSLLIDKNNHIWVGTTEGLFRQKRQTAAIEKVSILQNETPLDKLRQVSLIKSVDDKLFIGSNLGDLFVFKRDSLKLISQIAGIGQRMLSSIASINQDTLLIGTPGLLLNNKNLRYKSFSSFPYQAIWAYNDRNNNIYINVASTDTFYYSKAYEKGFAVLKFSELSKIRFPTQMVEDPEGNLWFAGQGIMRFNKLSRQFDLLLDSFPAFKIAKKSIISNLVFDKAGNVYFGLSDNGLIIYNPRQKSFSQLTRSDGLPDNIIRTLILYDHTLWLGTESGLASYNLVTKKVSSFATADGITIDGQGISSLYYDSVYNHIYAGLKNTLYRFNPDKFTKSTSPPVFFIENIIISGKDTIHHPGDKINLSYTQHNIVVHLAAINFEDGNEQQFAYRIVKNGNEAWILSGSQQSIIFSNLSPGNHRLQVKVFIRNQSWPDQIKEINILISPPFWKTAWFLIGIALLIAGAAYYLYTYRINQINQRANLDKLLAQTEMKALHTQMNPHFIFNCLNSIKKMILDNENNKASRYLSKFAQLIRITLNQSSKSFISLHSTIDYLERYLEMEQIRTNKFKYNIETESELHPEDIYLPPMLIQPLIENAIWHGELPEHEIMQIDIRFQKQDNKLVCIVEDNGIGIESSLKKKEDTINHHSLGIANIRQRIQVLNEKYNLHGTLIIEDKSTLNLGRGTMATLLLPIKNTDS